MNIRHLILILSLCILSGCTTLSKNGAQVRLASQVGSDCKFISVISASIMDQNGDNALRNKAAALGGNWVVVTGKTWQGAFKGNVASKGEAYACPNVGGSAKRVDYAISIDQNTTSRSVSSTNVTLPENDISKLKKLLKMRDEGLLTELEYQEKRKEVIDSI